METRKKGFTPEFDYLEDDGIRGLQLLYDDIVAAESEEARGNKLEILEEQFNGLYKRYCQEAKEDDTNLRQLIRFFRTNLKFLDKGGMNLGRSKIGILWSKLNEHIMAEHGDLVLEIEKE